MSQTTEQVPQRLPMSQEEFTKVSEEAFSLSQGTEATSNIPKIKQNISKPKIVKMLNLVTVTNRNANSRVFPPESVSLTNDIMSGMIWELYKHINDIQHVVTSMDQHQLHDIGVAQLVYKHFYDHFMQIIWVKGLLELDNFLEHHNSNSNVFKKFNQQVVDECLPLIVM